MFKKTTLSLAAAITLLAPVAASANDIDTVSVTVKIADLNLNSAKDQSRLNTRIKSAARKVCKTYNSRSLTENTHRARCMTAALERADSQVAIATAASKTGLRHAVNTMAVTAHNG